MSETRPLGTSVRDRIEAADGKRTYLGTLVSISIRHHIWSQVECKAHDDSAQAWRITCDEVRDASFIAAYSRH